MSNHAKYVRFVVRDLHGGVTSCKGTIYKSRMMYVHHDTPDELRKILDRTVLPAKYASNLTGRQDGYLTVTFEARYKPQTAEQARIMVPDVRHYVVSCSKGDHKQTTTSFPEATMGNLAKELQQPPAPAPKPTNAAIVSDAIRTLELSEQVHILEQRTRTNTRQIQKLTAMQAEIKEHKPTEVNMTIGGLALTVSDKTISKVLTAVLKEHNDNDEVNVAKIKKVDKLLAALV